MIASADNSVIFHKLLAQSDYDEFEYVELDVVTKRSHAVDTPSFTVDM